MVLALDNLLVDEVCSHCQGHSQGCWLVLILAFLTLEEVVKREQTDLKIRLCDTGRKRSNRNTFQIHLPEAKEKAGS